MYKFFRKYHKWLGVVLTLLILFFAISGIILNHREELARFEVSRKLLPQENRYKEWNNAAVKEMLQVSEDSVLLYGNIGIWLADGDLGNIREMNEGFPRGIDHRKIFKILEFNDDLYAGALFGLYRYDKIAASWAKIELPVKDKNVVDLLVKGDSLYALTRSDLLLSVDGDNFNEIKLPAPQGYNNKVSLFKTLWVIHSGEILGMPGRLFVDFLGIVLTFLTISGIILFIAKLRLKNRKISVRERDKQRRYYRWNLRWHNKLGWTIMIFLFVNTLTGMFLRPPLLVAIAAAESEKVPGTALDTDNAWFDIMRRVVYVEDEEIFLFSTTDGFFYAGNELDEMIKYEHQPPASVMGVTVLEPQGDGEVLLGSFNGLFSWNYKTDSIYDLLKEEVWVRPEKPGLPFGDYKVSGFGFDRNGKEVVFDYTHGVRGRTGSINFPEMPAEVIKKSPMSLWGYSLEIHTARILKPILGDFYVLVVPLLGIFMLFILVSGFVVWYKFFRKKKPKSKKS